MLTGNNEQNLHESLPLWRAPTHSVTRYTLSQARWGGCPNAAQVVFLETHKWMKT